MEKTKHRSNTCQESKKLELSIAQQVPLPTMSG